MATKNRYVNTGFWDDSWTAELSVKEKLLFLYLLTNPLTNMAGIYEISFRRIMFDTGLTKDDIRKALKGFERVRKVFYLEDCNYVILTNFLKHQKLNANMIKGVISLAEKFNPLVIEFLQMDSKGFESLSKALNNLNTNINLNLNTNTNTNQQTSTSEDVAVESDNEKAFDSWWELYEKKGNRKKTLEKWIKLDQEQRDKCFHVVTDYVKSTPEKQYRKNGETYLNQEAFNDEIIFQVNNTQSIPQQQSMGFGGRHGDMDFKNDLSTALIAEYDRLLDGEITQEEHDENAEIIKKRFANAKN